jgi:hypothetical protein
MTRPLRGLGTTLKQEVDRDGTPRGTHNHNGCVDSPWWISTWEGFDHRGRGPGHCRIAIYLPGRRGALVWLAVGKDQRRALTNCCRKVRASLNSYELDKAMRLAGVRP